MQSVEIKSSDIPKFMSLLFSSEVLDQFFVLEENIKTFADFKIMGRINRDFFDSEEKETLTEEYSTWGSLRLQTRELIKGKRLPLKLHIVFIAPVTFKTRVMEDESCTYSGDDLILMLNLNYEEGHLKLITASSVNSFSLDKSYESVWDREFLAFMNKLNLAYETE